MECKQMELEFAKTSFVHCFREANEVVDSQARNSLTIRSLGFWDSSIPDFISSLFVNDLTIRVSPTAAERAAR